jgi:hypothetical protein
MTVLRRSLFRTLFPNAIGGTLQEFLFGSACRRCKGGSFAKRWQRYDGTGSWRMHHTWIGPGHDSLIDYGDDYCARNGWFSRHWFTTTIIVIVIGLSLLVGVNVARAADRPEKPDAWFCFKARAAVLATGSEKAAEDAARAQGASEATIAKAKRCPR